MLSERYLYRQRGLYEGASGLVRTDRALLYVQQRLRTIIADVEARKTKSLGEVGSERVMHLAREMYPLFRMGDDPGIADMVMLTLRSLSPRTPKHEAVMALASLSDRLATYEVPRGDELTSLREELADDSDSKVSEDQVADERSVFVIMPFASELSDVWKGGIQRAAKEEGFRPIRVDMINRSTNITEDIILSIEKCRLAIVDVTGNNPNVMFELGYAIAKAKKNIIISQSAEFLPFDIRNIRTIVYSNTWSGIEELRARLQEFLRETAPSKHPKKTAKPSGKAG